MRINRIPQALILHQLTSFPPFTQTNNFQVALVLHSANFPAKQSKSLYSSTTNTLLKRASSSITGSPSSVNAYITSANAAAFNR